MRCASLISSSDDILLTVTKTTAHTLAFAFGLLAMHQDYQEKLYQQIKCVIPDGRLPVSLVLVLQGSAE